MAEKPWEKSRKKRAIGLQQQKTIMGFKKIHTYTVRELKDMTERAKVFLINMTNG